MSSLKTPFDRSLYKPSSTACHNSSTESGSTMKSVTIQRSRYGDISSPSSTASSSADEFYSQLSSSRRYRANRLLHRTQSLNKKYILRITNLFYEMQKDIIKLKRRTKHLERIVAKQEQMGYAIVRIPRLTSDQLSLVASTNKSRTEHKQSPSSSETNSSDQQSSASLSVKEIENSSNSDETKMSKSQIHCQICRRKFLSELSYHRHLRKVHSNDPISNISDDIDHSQNENLHRYRSKQQENDSISELYNNIWDSGEGRLRPRSAPKPAPVPIKKVRCEICNKYFGAAYIHKHIQCKHNKKISSVPPIELNKLGDEQEKTIDQPMYETISNPDESESNEIVDSPSTVTIIDMDMNETPIEFKSKEDPIIVFATSCLNHSQKRLVEEFQQAFPSVRQAIDVDARTTHLIVNDSQRRGRAPFTLKFMEAVANHCYCVSYLWLAKCIRFGEIVREEEFEIEGDENDFYQHGGPKNSRTVTQQNSLFENYYFILKRSEIENSQISNDRLRKLIVTCGGQIINIVTENILKNFQVVVICDKSYILERQQNYEDCRAIGIRFASLHWIIKSILSYTVQQFDIF